MADFRDFRRSLNMEDRRDEVLPLGPFGTPGLPPNVFEGGTLVNLSPADMPPETLSSLGAALGFGSLPIPQSDTQPRGSVVPSQLLTMPKTVSVDQSYLDAIKKFEGYAPKPQWDYKQSSSGYGTRAQPGDENIPADQLKAIHEQRFLDETAKAAASVDSFNPNLPPGVRAALTSLTYNAGPGWQQSGLGQAVKSGDYDRAREIFLQYNKAGGEVNPGLVARRQKEAAWFGGPPQATAQPAQPQTAQAAPAAPASGLLAQAQASPGGLAPSPQFGGLLQPPTFPQQAQQAAPTDPGFFAQIPAEQAMQAPPIHFAQRRPVNLTALRNTLAQRAPFFAKG